MAGETWRLLRTWDASPGFHMAFDEALLAAADPTPVLRFYTWRPDALSLGYFQRHDEVLAALARRGLGPGSWGAIVRRMTGGGAIHHVSELTFSIAAPADHPLYRGPIADSYARVHGWIAEALAARGARAAPRAAAALASDDAASPMCFHGSAPVDLAWGGRKGVGSAQRRTGGRVLHHGSIKLGTSPLEGAIATLAGVTAEDLADDVAAAFATGLGVAIEAGAPREEELLHARAREAHFTSEAFVRRR
jgi:lipoate-protein ligase A